MRYLIDTNILIWYIRNQKEFLRNNYNIIDNPENDIYISVITIWEIALKTSKKLLDIGIDLNGLYHLIQNRKFILLPINQNHLEGILNLPPIHKDPFDRLLIATAKSENLPIITTDKCIHQYDVDWIWKQ